MVARLAQSHRQRGVVMYVAIVVLLVMTLAGIAMIRQIGSGVSIAGNLAFKKNATSVADLGTEAALTWLENAPSLETDSGPRYFSSAAVNFDPRALNWNNADSALATNNDGTGNEVRYVIHRLCTVPGLAVDAVGQNCVSELAEASDHEGCPGCMAMTLPPLPYFRITTRVRGPRNTFSYTQAIVLR